MRVRRCRLREGGGGAGRWPGCTITVQAGDVIRLLTPGGGGWGVSPM